MSFDTLVDPNDPDPLLHHKPDPGRPGLAICQPDDGPRWLRRGVCGGYWGHACKRCSPRETLPAARPDRPVQRAADGHPGDDDVSYTGSEYVDRIGARRVLAWLRRWLT